MKEHFIVEINTGYSKRQSVKFKMLYSKRDIDLVKNNSWFVTMDISGSARIVDRKHKQFTSYLFEDKKGYVVDHIDGDSLNNKRSNLRQITRQQNGLNKKTPTTNTSGHIGVRFDKKRDRWKALVSYEGKSYSKYLNNKHDAIIWRYTKEKELFGEFMRDRNIEEILDSVENEHVNDGFKISFKKLGSVTNFPVVINDEIVAYCRDEYVRKRFMNTQKFKDALESGYHLKT
jgi:hypothetical protein